VGRDAQSAFNTVRRQHVRGILHNHEWLREWIDDWLAPRRFRMEVDGQELGSVTVTGGTPQGSPLSLALFTVYMSKRGEGCGKATHAMARDGIAQGEEGELLATILY